MECVTAWATPLFHSAFKNWTADGENNFDELKNHWGWGGFKAQKVKSCRIISRIIVQFTMAGSTAEYRMKGPNSKKADPFDLESGAVLVIGIFGSSFGDIHRLVCRL